jgi:mRNA interferase RelE/StbE
MEILFERSFERDLKKIRDKRLLKQVRRVIQQVETAAELSEITNLKKLKGFDGYYELGWGNIESGLKCRREKLSLFVC